MMAVKQCIRVGKGRVAAGVDKDAARQREVSVNVGVDVGEVILALQDGIVDLGMVEGEPRLHVLIDTQKLGEGRPLFLGCVVCFGFEPDHIVLNVFSGGIDLVIIPQAIARICPGDQEGKAHGQTDQTI